jgi:caa(3)-type oxidase subunit IV
MATKSRVHHTNYAEIWAILVALLLVSVGGSMSSTRGVVLVAAFGVALVKAYLVAKNFMHITVEKRWVPYLLLVMIAFIVILFAGVAPDVMRHSGLRWSNDAAKQAVESGMKATPKNE